MTENAAVRLWDESVLPLRERKRALDSALLWSLFAIFAAIGVAWFFHALEIDLSAVVWSVFGFATIYFLAARATDLLRSKRALWVSLLAQQALGILFLAVLWHLIGGLDNPAFLLAFFLPVLASGVLLMRGPTLLSAALAVVSVTLIALCESPDLRWSFDQLPLLAPLVRFLPRGLPGHPEALPRLEMTPASQILLLQMFTALLLLAAFVARSLAVHTSSLFARLETSAGAREGSRELFGAVLQADPVPTVLVFADTHQVLLASQSFIHQMLLTPEELSGKSLFELVAFSDPDRVRRLIVRGSGEAAFCSYRVGPETRVARIRVHRVPFQRGQYVSVSLVDQDELFYLATAFEQMEEPFLVLDVERRVACFNRAAADLFVEIDYGMKAERLFAAAAGPLNWWETVGEERPEPRIAIAGRLVRVRSIPTRSTENGLTILAFHQESAPQRVVAATKRHAS